MFPVVVHSTTARSFIDSLMNRVVSSVRGWSMFRS
jgi:hypothetical protein